jgi:hypothetical protein
LLEKNLNFPFEETPNWGASFDHNNPWSWVKPFNWNYVTEKQLFDQTKYSSF